MVFRVLRKSLVGGMTMALLVAIAAVTPASAQGLGGSTSSGGDDSSAPAPTPAIDKSKLPPRATYQAMLDYGKKSGWVAFRNYGGKQLVYFTHLQTMHCRLQEIRYSINSSDLDQRFPLVACNVHQPFSLPGDSKLGDIALRLAPGTAAYVAVQVVWEDGGESEVAVYEPCKNVGDSSCAALVE